MKEPLVIFTSWGGAQYLDWWLLVHLLGGLALGYACRVYGLSFIYALVIVGAILVGWEVYEELANIAEPWTNTLLDIFFGLVGIWLAYEVVLFENFSMNFWLAGLLLLIWGGLNVWGWFAWQAREAKASQLQAEAEKVMTTIDH